ncbi:MAG: single-stranded-DNA-specific exonuclease [Alphaproteobacteria bacterium]|jgi:single-stranded-DNA-specific exonuclease
MTAIAQKTDEKHAPTLSAGGAVWDYLTSEHKLVQQIATSYDLPPQIAHILCARGINVLQAEKFLAPKLKHEMPDPYHLKDMEKAVKIVADAMLSGKKIGVFGDYDVDGGTSSAIMYRLFNALQTVCFVHIPDRMTEGYGPNIHSFLKLKDKGADIIITVDCGSSAPDVMMQAKENGLQAIILDHHLTDGDTQGAEATVNPNRADDLSGLGILTAAGVCFLFSVALVRYLEQQNYFIDSRPKPNLMMLLDLVALGTVCDVAPLIGLNRAFVAQGIKVIESGNNIGLHHLGLVAQVTGKIAAYHCGFVYGPRINAGGRVGRASAGFELLTTECEETAKKIAAELNIYNLERKTIEDQVKEEALKQIETENLSQDSVIIVHSHNWHHGVVGIVASRIKDMFYRPCFVLGGDADNKSVFKGSGRSISGVNIGDAVKQAVTDGILEAGGGHKAAAGLTVQGDNIPALRAYFNQALGNDVATHGAYKKIKVDAVLSITAANTGLLVALEALAPFGVENPSPTFGLENLTITYMQPINDKHIRLKLMDQNRASLNAICFNCIGNEVGDILLNKKNKIDIIGSLKHDTYHTSNGVQFIIDDCRIAV